jgi:hypothetical protein
MDKLSKDWYIVFADSILQKWNAKHYIAIISLT